MLIHLFVLSLIMFIYQSLSKFGMLKQKYVILLLVLILLMGAVFRLYDLSKESLWTDEAFSVHHAQQKTIASISHNVEETEAAPIGYYLVLHYWIRQFGDSEFSVRLLSVIFGLLSLVVFFLLVSLLLNKTIALLSSCLMAASMLQVLYSQEARLYSLFTFLVLVSTYFFSKIILNEKNKKSSWSYYLFYVVSIIASIYTNYLSVFLIMGYILVIFWNWRWTKKLFVRWIWVHVLVSLACFSLVPVLLNQFHTLNQGLASSINKGVPYLLAQFGLFIFVIPFLTLILLFILILIFKEAILQKLSLISDKLFLAVLILCGLFYLYLATHSLSLFNIPMFRVPITHSYFLVRHSFFLAPLLYVLISYRITKIKPKLLIVLAILFIIIVNSFSLYVYYHEPTKAEWKEAVASINRNNEDNSNVSLSSTLILLDNGGFSNMFILNYYYPLSEIVRMTWSNRSVNGRKSLYIDEDSLLSLLNGHNDFWLVLANNDDLHYRELLDTLYDRDIEQKFYGVEIYHYTK